MLVVPDGTVLKLPSEAEIAAALGLPTTPTTDFYDLIVIGGPLVAGSAVYGASEGLRTVLPERQATGDRPGRAPASRTTSASRARRVRGPSSPTGRGGRR